MAYTNFIQEFWSKHIQTELGKHTVFADFCDYKFQGEIKHGAQLHIPGVSRPTVRDYVKGTPITREVVADSGQTLDINYQKYFDFEVDDIDKAQAVEGLMETLTREGSIALAEAMDADVAKAVPTGTLVTKATAITTEAAAIEALDEAFVKLWDAGVPNTERTRIEVTPWFYNLIKGKIIDVSTDNKKLIESGVLGLYNNGEVKITNNIYNDGTYDNLCIRTKKGIALAKQIEKVEPYRPHDGFEDAVKALLVYGIKVVRPKEVICLQVKNA